MQIPEIDKVIQSVVDNLPGKVGAVSDEVHEYLRQALSSSLKKMDLVTRHEFDVQTAVLQKTRSKVDELENTLKAIESQLLNKH